MPSSTPTSPPCKSPKGDPIDWATLKGNEVLLNVYDLGERESMRKINTASAAIGGGVYHAGVEIFGVEFAYGATEITGTGVTKCYPRCHPGHTYRSTVMMGQTKFSEFKVNKIMERLVDEWQGNEYHFIRKNCLDFSNALCQELGVGKIPGWVDRYGRTAEKLGNVLSAPVGAFRKGTRFMTGRSNDASPSRSIERGISDFRPHSGQAIDLRGGDDLYTSEIDSWDGTKRLDLNEGRRPLADNALSPRSARTQRQESSSSRPSAAFEPSVSVASLPMTASKGKQGSEQPDAKPKAKPSAKLTAKGKAKAKAKSEAKSETKSEAKQQPKSEDQTGTSNKTSRSASRGHQKTQVERTKLIAALFDDYDQDRDKFLNESELRNFIRCSSIKVTPTEWKSWYAGVCQEVAAKPQEGLDKKQFKLVIKDISETALDDLRKGTEQKPTSPTPANRKSSPVPKAPPAKPSDVPRVHKPVPVSKISGPAKITVTIVSATGLPNADIVGHSDPYCSFHFAGQSQTKCTTDHVDDTGSPEWNESFDIDHAPGKDLVFEVWDKDTVSKDDLLGKATLKHDKFFPNGFNGDLILTGRRNGVRPKLQVRIHVTLDGSGGATRIAAPLGQLQDLPTSPKGPTLMVFILSAKGLPNSDWISTSDPYCTCELSDMPETRVATKVKDSTLNPQWDESFEMPYSAGANLNFAVYDKDTMSDDLLGKTTLRHDMFYPDGFQGELTVQNTKKGSKPTLCVKVVVPPLGSATPVRQISPIAVPDVGSGVKLKIVIKSAKGLRNADMITKSDPFCTCEFAGLPETQIQTRVVKDNLDPDWNETFVISHVANKNLDFVVWDRDVAWKDDDFLGKATLRSDTFYPDGFDGALQLEQAGEGVTATLQVKVVIQNLSAKLKSQAKAQERKEVVGLLFDAFDIDGDARLKNVELRSFVDRLGFEGDEKEWNAWYLKSCSSVSARSRVGVNKDQFTALIADTETEKLQSLLADVDTSKSTESRSRSTENAAAAASTAVTERETPGQSRQGTPGKTRQATPGQRRQVSPGSSRPKRPDGASSRTHSAAVENAAATADAEKRGDTARESTAATADTAANQDSPGQSHLGDADAVEPSTPSQAASTLGATYAAPSMPLHGVGNAVPVPGPSPADFSQADHKKFQEAFARLVKEEDDLNSRSPPPGAKFESLDLGSADPVVQNLQQGKLCESEEVCCMASNEDALKSVAEVDQNDHCTTQMFRLSGVMPSNEDTLKSSPLFKENDGCSAQLLKLSIDGRVALGIGIVKL